MCRFQGEKRNWITFDVPTVGQDEVAFKQAR